MNSLGVLGKENWSPLRPNKSAESGFANSSPFGLLASPMSNIDLMSPESTLSFSLSSPPPNNHLKIADAHSSREMLSANISPSIFSPDENLRSVQRFSNGEKESQFATIHLFEDSNGQGFFPKEISFDKKSQKKSLRSKIKQDSETGKEKSNPCADIELSSSKYSTCKAKKLSATKPPPDTPDMSSQSPHNDLARRLSLESNSEPVARNLRIPPDTSKATLSVAVGKKIVASVVKSSPSRTTCNCKKSRCLKLYCDCFAVLKHCDSTYCNCVQCYNNVDNEDKRSEAIKSTKEKNLLAFQTKISDKEQHVTGCHCKNSHCLKKYCECFTGGALCGVNCKCQSCKNYEGSLDLMKTREASPKSDPGKKRKESPNGVDWIDENSPQITKLESINQAERKSTPYSFRSRTKETQKQYTDYIQDTNTVKRRKVKFATTPYIYPFFGKIQTPKIIALKCLDFLSNKDIYTMSQVSSIWNQVAMDEALWE